MVMLVTRDETGCDIVSSGQKYAVALFCAEVIISNIGLHSAVALWNMIGNYSTESVSYSCVWQMLLE